MSDIAKEILKNLSEVFRYVLPGVLVLAGAHEAYPSWFLWLQLEKVSHLVVIAVVAIVAGNTWYVFHRFAVLQIIDLACYWVGLRGPAADRPTWRAWRNYLDDLGRYVARSFSQPPERDALRGHVALRASSVVLMYIAAEVLIVFRIRPEAGTLYDRHGREFLVIGGVAFLFAVWQSIVTRRIDWYVQNQP